MLAEIMPEFFQEFLNERENWKQFFLNEIGKNNHNNRIEQLPHKTEIYFKSINHPFSLLKDGIHKYFSKIIGNNYSLEALDQYSFVFILNSKEALLNYIGFSYSLIKLTIKEKNKIFRKIETLIELPTPKGAEFEG